MPGFRSLRLRPPTQEARNLSTLKPGSGFEAVLLSALLHERGPEFRSGREACRAGSPPCTGAGSVAGGGRGGGGKRGGWGAPTRPPPPPRFKVGGVREGRGRVPSPKTIQHAAGVGGP